MRPTIDLLYLAHSRPEFTSVSLLNLLANTDWSLISQFHIFTDGDTELWQRLVQDQPRFAQLHCHTKRVGGPVAALNLAAEIGQADYICKIDNDVMVPKGWVEYSTAALVKNSDVDLLGIEAWANDPEIFPEMGIKVCLESYPSGAPLRAWENWGQIDRVRPVRHIGGIGFFRRSALLTSPPLPRCDSRYGLTEWQWSHSHLTKAFLDPTLPIFLLDHLPFDPWFTLSQHYESIGVQRRTWGSYPLSLSTLWDWWEGKPTTSLPPTPNVRM